MVRDEHGGPRLSPYAAVIVDSFRAALANRVLWVALISIWIILALLAPVGYRENLTGRFTPFDLYNGTRLKAMLARGLEAEDGTAVSRLAAAMPEGIRSTLKKVAGGENVGIPVSDLSDALNEFVEAPAVGSVEASSVEKKAAPGSSVGTTGETNERTWYDAAAWAELPRSAEAIRLERMGDDRTTDQQRRLNRLRIEAALPGVFAVRSTTSVRPTYAGLEFPFDLPLDRRRFVTIVNQLVVPLLVSWLLGFVLVFLGIIVTAPIIPGMLQPGSLHLLLSKPITRGGLLTAKFFGGCAFVLICVTQLVIGLYLIVGWRLDLWNARLLWIIPTSVLLFGVFYSVSVFAGLVFRSEVLSIGITCVFGGVVLLTGFIGGLFDSFVSGRDRAAEIDRLGEHLVMVTRGGDIKRFDRERKAWTDLVPSADSDRRMRMAMPIRVESEGRSYWVTAKLPRGRNPFGQSAPDAAVIVPNDDFSLRPSIRLPTGTTALVTLGEKRLAALNTVSLAAAPVRDFLEPDEPDDRGVAGLVARLMGGLEDGFENILPPEVVVAPPARVAMDDATGRLAVASGSRLWCLGSGDGGYRVVDQIEIPGPSTSRFRLAWAGGCVVVAKDEADVVWFDAGEERLQEVARWPAPAEAYADLLGFPDRTAIVLDATGVATRCRPLGDSTIGVDYRLSDIAAIGSGDDGDLLTVSGVDTAEVRDPATGSVRQSYRPRLSTWRRVDRYLLTPLRFIVPQTGELGDVISTAISGRSTVVVGDPSEDETGVLTYRWGRPLLSCGGFLSVMMLVNWWYFRTRDF